MSILLGAVLLISVPAAPAQPRLTAAVVLPYGDENSESRAVFSTPLDLPPNVTIPAAFADFVEDMLRSSPTFRAQCSRIAREASLRVVVRKSLLAPAQAAITRLIRRSDGYLDAEVELGAFGDVVLLVAHEFEHIIEQLDGVDLTSMAARPGTGVRTDPRTGQFETDRAIVVGRLVARETSHAVARR